MKYQPVILIIILSYFITACGPDEQINIIQEETPSISIDYKRNELYINGKAAPAKQLASVIKKEFKGKDKDQIIKIKASKNVKMGTIADMQFTLREMAFRKLIFESLQKN
ncbi:ExbD/TolR family protein [Echinicola salinicaeni]|uniref:ExbD/TolR family protein n=1 Tax=Echinicola salinicaeni TaxID=2762757 RepID=UPI001644E633|nr:biopolymer transporter ExbD [Echinicola salinicaeni]